EEAVVDFAAQADARLAPYRIEHGASLYGIAADRPTQIAQDVSGLADHLDYVSPMIYPSHWGPGEYDVADPNRQPYDIITATLEVWKAQTDGKRARIVPWLEDTNYRAWDRPFQVREQIRATLDQGIDEWLMWDPVVNYTIEAYEPR
ncbi:MAG: putative glycoside hydrolase, partial [Nitriliruptor sp.]|uniref:putative glycoside hydrolase n=1 Tax=Nitriliruptor sp. TaxID=2448056 RepID=UPI0034A07025